MEQTPGHSLDQPGCREDDEHQSLEQQLLLLPEPLHYDLLDYFYCLNFSQRRSFILEILDRLGIAHQVLRIGNGFHIIIKPDYELSGQSAQEENAGLFRIKAFVAHYDRRLQTPGSSDNSAAVWHLLNLAAQMKRERPSIKTPMQIIFTDHEELRPKEDAGKQGAYLLARHLYQLSPKLRYVFFVFDQCGIGDTLCYLPNIVTRKSVLAQQDKILRYAGQTELGNIPIEVVHRDQYFFSDNLGFNLWDYPALLFSTLPRNEVRLWQSSGEKPASWANAHAGTPDLLEAGSFALMNQVLSRLCRI